jgi:hypothetical protein
MKKILLSLVALFMGIGMAVAQEKTVVITGADALWSSTAGKQTGTKDGVTISTTQGTLGSGTQYRAYKNQTFTVSVAEGNITKIELTCTASGTAKEGPGNFTDATSGTYTFSGKVGTWTGSASEVTMKASQNQVRMTEIKVTYQIGESTGPEAVSLALTEASPVQTEYYEGDAFNPEGLVATATFDDETTADVTAEVAGAEVAEQNIEDMSIQEVVEKVLAEEDNGVEIDIDEEPMPAQVIAEIDGEDMDITEQFKLIKEFNNELSYDEAVERAVDWVEFGINKETYDILNFIENKNAEIIQCKTYLAYYIDAMEIDSIVYYINYFASNIEEDEEGNEIYVNDELQLEFLNEDNIGAFLEYVQQLQ